MERASCVRSLSQIEDQIAKFKPQPREGQRQAIEGLSEHQRKLSVKLPTGYGKTYLALATYSILKQLGEVNRLLVIFPTDGQLVQFEQATPRSWPQFASTGPSSVCDIRFFGSEAIRKHQRDACQIYAITVQSLIGARGMDNVAAMLAKGRWMVVVDEYHHYGIEKPFGLAVNALQYEFLLCMSATPHRPDDDSAFGSPDIAITYREAMEEKAVKPLCGHSYNYKIDAVNDDGEVITFTTERLVAEAGSDKPDAVEKLIVDRSLRWSPKYISPLITNPIDRMLTERLRTGYKLQAIIGAFCVSHAELVCQQVSSTYPSLTVEWVGTGRHGRKPEENAAILTAFAPTNGTAPTIDVLVHVGMAGEGLDTVMVSEVIHLNAAGHNNTNNQENGRAARYLPGVVGNINFDACSGFAIKKYVGRCIMDAMDDVPPKPQECKKCGKDPCVCEEVTKDEWNDLPDEPTIRLVDVQCISIDSGDATVQMAIKGLSASPVMQFTLSDFDDPDGPAMKEAIRIVTHMRTMEAEACNEKSVVCQWKDAVEQALSVLAGNVIRMAKHNGMRVDKAFIADVKKRINGRKKREIGSVETSVESYKRHYGWIKRTESQLKTATEVPEWLL